jgi:hypothetical protein
MIQGHPVPVGTGVYHIGSPPPHTHKLPVHTVCKYIHIRHIQEPPLWDGGLMHPIRTTCRYFARFVLKKWRLMLQ